MKKKEELMEKEVNKRRDEKREKRRRAAIRGQLRQTGEEKKCNKRVKKSRINNKIFKW